jgi:hypothetical protein
LRAAPALDARPFDGRPRFAARAPRGRRRGASPRLAATPGTETATLRAARTRPLVHQSAKDAESPNIVARAGSDARL